VAHTLPLVRWFARAACTIFYRVDAVGGIPADGAVLILPNHANALVDPAIIWATAGRDVRFLAKSTLFRWPTGPLLRGAGVIPVYRRLDEGVDTARNAEMFAAVQQALLDRSAVCIFPEGISHSTGRLEPLRTGAARIALAAERAGAAVAIVPVGLNFDRKTMFRSRVTIVFGAPFSATDLAAAQDHASAVRTLTTRIAERMRGLLVEADPEADAALVDRVDRLYTAARGRPSEPSERVERRRLIAVGMERLRAVDPGRYEAVLLRVRRYDQRLSRFGIRDRHLDWHVSAADSVRFAVRELLLGLILLPVSAAGIVICFVPYQLTGMIARIASPYPDVLATAQVLTGTAVYAAWFALIAAAIAKFFGALAGVMTFVALPLFAIGALFAIERESAVLEAVRAWLLLRRARDQTRARLRRTRSDLADVLDEVHESLNAANSGSG
jgi:glycerol-3-phosphate O-acyltransferase / dihydroxyacetone phosphate acyltransferase